MASQKINHLAVWACLVLLHVLGFLWYGPLFGDQWMRMAELDPGNMESGAEAGLWITNFVASLAPLYLLAWLFAELNVVSGVRGAVIAFLITFCIHHLFVMSGNMFAGEPYGLAWITGGFRVLSLTLSGFILGAWPKKVP